ncbi:hypothetical protein [Anaerococcus senegalensis]|nr:hypothetical protein [Anaerococcus senegalensis]
MTLNITPSNIEVNSQEEEKYYQIIVDLPYNENGNIGSNKSTR